MNAFMADMQLDPLPEVAAVEMLDATGPEPSSTVPIRLYRPKTAGTGALPITVYFCAGGNVFGDLDGMESLCRLLCREAGCLVALVDWRPRASSRRRTRTPTPRPAGSPKTPPRSAPIRSASPSPATRPAARRRSVSRCCDPGVRSAGDTESMKQLSGGYFLTARLMKWSMGHYLNDPSELENSLIQPLRR